MYKNNVLICISGDDNYRLGGNWLHSKTTNLDLDRLTMEGPYESVNQQRTLTTWIEGYTKTLSDTKVAVNSICIVFSKVRAFTYEIRNLDPLTQTLGLL
jgi:hypothetical protein